MAKWISRALAFVKVFAARLECPFAKSSAGCSQAGSQSVIQTAPAASLPVCVSLKSIKMLQIKLKVSTFFHPLPLSHSAASWASSRLGIGTWLWIRMRIQIPLRFGFGFICMRNIFKWQLQIFLLHTSQQHFCQFSFSWKLLFNFFVNCWSRPSLSLYLSLCGSLSDCL